MVGTIGQTAYIDPVRLKVAQCFGRPVVLYFVKWNGQYCGDYLLRIGVQFLFFQGWQYGLHEIECFWPVVLTV